MKLLKKISLSVLLVFLVSCIFFKLTERPELLAAEKLEMKDVEETVKVMGFEEELALNPIADLGTETDHSQDEIIKTPRDLFNLSLAPWTNQQGEPIVEIFDENTLIDSKYVFSTRAFPDSSYVLDGVERPINNHPTYVPGSQFNPKSIVYLPSDGSILYRKIGLYQGRYVDSKLSARMGENSRKRDLYFSINREHFMSVKNVVVEHNVRTTLRVKQEYFDHETGEPLNGIAGFLTVGPMNQRQNGGVNKNTVTTIIVPPNKQIGAQTFSGTTMLYESTDNNNLNPDFYEVYGSPKVSPVPINDALSNALMVLFETKESNSVEYMSSVTGSSYNQLTLEDNRFFGRFAFPDLVKLGKETTTKEGTVDYQLIQNFPPSEEAFKFTDFVIEDQLKPYLDQKTLKVEIKNNLGKDFSKYFKVVTDEQNKLTITFDETKNAFDLGSQMLLFNLSIEPLKEYQTLAPHLKKEDDTYYLFVPNQGKSFVNQKMAEKFQQETTTEEVVSKLAVTLNKVVTHHVDEEGANLIDPTEELYFPTETYTTASRATELPGYVLDQEPANSTGIAKAEVTDVYYSYKRQKKVKLITKYLDQEGEEIIPDVIEEKTYGEKYQTVEADLSLQKYVFDRMEGQASGTVSGEEDIVVKYYYRFGKLNVKTRHVFIKEDSSYGDVFPDNQTVDQLKGFDEEYTTNSRESEAKALNYKLVETLGEASGKTGFSEEDLVITYVYQKANFELIVPELIDFGSQKLITWGSKELLPLENIKVSILDDLDRNWQLSLRIKSAFIGGQTSAKLAGSFSFKKISGGIVPISDTSILVNEREAPAVTTDLEWKRAEQQGLVLKQLPGNTLEKFSGKFEWSLVDGL